MRVALLKWLILRWLSECPLSGYQILKRCSEMFGKASPGSVYPALHQMIEKGLVKREKGRFALTRRGRTLIKKLEHEREEHIRKVRHMLIALSELFDDPGLRYVADTMSDWSQFSPTLLETLFDLRNEIVRLGDAALPVLRKAVKELRDLSCASNRM